MADLGAVCDTRTWQSSSAESAFCANSPPSGRPSQSRCVIAPTEPASGRRRPLAGSVIHAYCLGCLRDPESRAASQPSSPARISAGPGCWRWNSSPHRAPPAPGLTLAVTEAGWHRLRARRRCPALASPRSSETSWYAHVTCRRAISRSRPAGRTGLWAAPQNPHKSVPATAIPTKNPRTERHYPAQDGTGANMAMLALTSLYAGSAGLTILKLPVVRAGTDLLKSGRSTVRSCP